MFVMLTTVVFSTTTLLTIRGPPQPPHQGLPANSRRPHQGTHGSPHPSATQPTPGLVTPKWTPKRGPWKKATSAGAYSGLTTLGPGAQPQKP